MESQAFGYSRQELKGSCPWLGQQGGYHTGHIPGLLEMSCLASFTPRKLNAPEIRKALIFCWAGTGTKITYSEICAFDNQSDIIVTFSWKTAEGEGEGELNSDEDTVSSLLPLNL